MNDDFDDVKRLKAFEKLFVWLGENKITIKDLDNPEEHFTMLFKSDGILDVHKTKEGTEKGYESLGKFDLLGLAKELVKNPQIFVNAVTDLVGSIQKINFDEDEYAHLLVANMKTKEEFYKIFKKEKRKAVIPKEALDEFQIGKSTFLWKEAKNKIKDNALVFDKDIPIGYIFKKEKEFFYVPINVMEKSNLAELVSKMTNPEKIDKDKEHKNQK